MNTMNKSSLNSTKFSTSRIMEIVWIFLICDNSSGEYFLKYYFLITSFLKIMPNFCQHVILFTMISDVFLWVLTYVCWFLAINLTNFNPPEKFHKLTEDNIFIIREKTTYNRVHSRFEIQAGHSHQSKTLAGRWSEMDFNLFSYLFPKLPIEPTNIVIWVHNQKWSEPPW